MTYKNHDLPPGTGLIDLELGQETDMTYYEWITDSTVDAGEGWGYVKGPGLQDRGQPGRQPGGPGQQERLPAAERRPESRRHHPRGSQSAACWAWAKWLEVNGEAIYGTTPGSSPAKGRPDSTRPGISTRSNDLRYTAQDIRFTAKENVLYATVLAWPGEKVPIKSLAGGPDPSRNFRNGAVPVGDRLRHHAGRRQGVAVGSDAGMASPSRPQNGRPASYAFVFKIVRRRPE